MVACPDRYCSFSFCSLLDGDSLAMVTGGQFLTSFSIEQLFDDVVKMRFQQPLVEMPSSTIQDDLNTGSIGRWVSMDKECRESQEN